MEKQNQHHQVQPCALMCGAGRLRPRTKHKRLRNTETLEHTPASQERKKESERAGLWEHVSLQPTWDSEQRRERQLHLSLHTPGDRHTQTTVYVCGCQTERLRRGSHSFFPPLFLLEASAEQVRPSPRWPTPEWTISLWQIIMEANDCPSHISVAHLEIKAAVIITPPLSWQW